MRKQKKMIKKRVKELYQPPYAQDLSGLGAIGQVQPMGYCTDGSNPYTSYSNCSPGLTHTLGACKPGSIPQGTCIDGGSVHIDCMLGSVPN